MTDLITLRDAAALLSARDGRSISAGLVRQWVRAGRFATARKIGVVAGERGMWVIERAEAAEFQPNRGVLQPRRDELRPGELSLLQAYRYFMAAVEGAPTYARFHQYILAGQLATRVIRRNQDGRAVRAIHQDALDAFIATYLRTRKVAP
jgi:hypothetical protein